MSLTKEAAIQLASVFRLDEPDLRTVHPIPFGEGKWLIEVKYGLWRWVVSSREELESGMRIIFGDPPDGTVGSENETTEGDPVLVSSIFK